MTETGKNARRYEQKTVQFFRELSFAVVYYGGKVNSDAFLKAVQH